MGHPCSVSDSFEDILRNKVNNDVTLLQSYTHFHLVIVIIEKSKYYTGHGHYSYAVFKKY